MSIISLPLEFLDKLLDAIDKPSDLLALVLSSKSFSKPVLSDHLDHRIIQCSLAGTRAWQHDLIDLDGVAESTSLAPTYSCSPSSSKTVKEKDIPKYYDSTWRSFEEKPFVLDHLSIVISQYTFRVLQERYADGTAIMNTFMSLEELRDTLPPTGLIKLNFGKLMMPRPKKGTLFKPDAVRSFKLALLGEDENYRKVFDDWSSDDDLYQQSKTATFVSRRNTKFDINLLARSLKDFGGPDINTLEVPGPIELDLGSCEIRKITLGRVINRSQEVPTRALWRVTL
ncbi:hypothetical protein M422DRAFT_250584 [Sphaerobolus stellatus SS14]|uniref:F-box domain-containing protein n=1 Tax=Sphaerobolus stellatus (strain SS14) TaxID=990650 RepID=A0A0C9VT95_SPHS4|nr:hypothetical protein M422DRAFT_250584 [Sphaerobolus stellatus SS14]